MTDNSAVHADPAPGEPRWGFYLADTFIEVPKRPIEAAGLRPPCTITVGVQDRHIVEEHAPCGLDQCDMHQTAPTPAPATDENHARIWLEPSEGYDPSEGRQWCQDDVWTGNPDYGECGPPTEYVRADIAAAAHEAGRRERDAEVAGLREALIDARAFAAAELDVRIDSHTLGGNLATLDDTDAGIVGEAMDCLARIDAALAGQATPHG